MKNFGFRIANCGFKILLCLLAFYAPALAQDHTAFRYRLRNGAGDPLTCSPGDTYFNLFTHKHRLCDTVNHWTDEGGPAGAVTCAGCTTNFLPKTTGAGTLGNSRVFDDPAGVNGGSVSVNTGPGSFIFGDITPITVAPALFTLRSSAAAGTSNITGTVGGSGTINFTSGGAFNIISGGLLTLNAAAAGSQFTGGVGIGVAPNSTGLNVSASVGGSSGVTAKNTNTLGTAVVSLLNDTSKQLLLGVNSSATVNAGFLLVPDSAIIYGTGANGLRLSSAVANGFIAFATGSPATFSSERWRIDINGHFLAGTDNSWDIGASGATRPRNGFFGTNVTSPLFTGAATALKSATTSVDVSAATAPSVGQVLTATDSTHATWQAAGGGITSLNGLSGATQTFAVGTAGTDFAINSSGTAHTFNIPSASQANRGLVNLATQDFAGVKNFSSNVNHGAGLNITNTTGNRVVSLHNNTGGISIASGSKYFFSDSATESDLDVANAQGNINKESATILRIGTGAGANSSGGLRLSNFYFNQLADSATAPTLSGFGTSPTIAASNGTIAFGIDVGTGGTASTGTINLPAATGGWICTLTNYVNNASSVTEQSGAGTTTSVPVTNYSRTTGLVTAWAAHDILGVTCRAY